MPESSVRPQPIHGHRQEIGTQIESADNKRGRAEEQRSVGVEPLVGCRPA